MEEVKKETVKAPVQMQMSPEDLLRIISSLKKELQDTRNELAKVTSTLTKLTVLGRIIGAPEGTYHREYVAKCVDMTEKLTDEFCNV